MSQDTTEKAQSLKNLLSRLREINSILLGSDSKLDYLATNTPQDQADTKEPSGDTATLDELNSVVESIARKANQIAKSTNIIVGS